jgi:hypothetical protein
VGRAAIVVVATFIRRPIRILATALGFGVAAASLALTGHGGMDEGTVAFSGDLDAVNRRLRRSSVRTIADCRSAADEVADDQIRADSG